MTRHADEADDRRFFESIVENIPDMIFVKRASDHMFVRFNRAGEELLGWSRDELLGKTDHDFYPKPQADFFHQKDREALAGKKLVDIPEEPIQTRHHGERILHTKKIPILDEQGRPLYLLGISEDITERKAAEQRLREFADVVRHASDAIVVWTPDGRIVSWNPAAERLYGMPASDAVGQRFESFVPKSQSAAFRAAQKRLLAGETIPVAETIRVRADGHEIEVEESVFAVLDAAGKPIRMASIARDVTELARLRRATEILVGSAGDDEAPTKSPRMREALDAADLVAQDASVTVLLLGETGVGKGWLARRIHARSPRAKGPFFEINCAGLSKELVESELFGHERGAFTGAMAQKRGLVEAADGGTVFLDEIGELSMAVQGQLLTFLDSHTFRRVGGNTTLKADVRLLAATNVDLKQAVARGTFRRDLFYRLSVVPIEVPPLRERREDIPQLARRLAAELARRGGRRRITLGQDVTAALSRYDWPGNVRELRNALERSLILSRSATIDLDHLPPELRQDAHARARDTHRLDALEETHILRVLAEHRGNHTRAADALGISRSTLKRKLAEIGPPAGRK